MAFNKQLITNLILTFCLIFSLIYGVLWTIHPVEGRLISGLNFEQIGGIIAVTMNYLIFYKAKRFYKYSIILTLFLGLINLLIFTPFDSYSTLTIGTLPIRIQNVSFLLIVLVYILNFRRANDSFIKQFKPSDSETETKRKEIIDSYKVKFKKHDEGALVSISESTKYNHFAKLAASELLKEMNNLKKNTD